MSSPTKHLALPNDVAAFVDSVDTFLLDCDGVLWRGDDVLDGVVETIAKLRSKGKQILFVTNNSTKSRATYVKKLSGLGIQATEEEIFGSAYATAYYLRNTLNFPKDKKVYVIGQAGITTELANVGIESCGAEEDIENVTAATMHTIKPDARIGAVITGFDIHFNYKKLAKAFTYLRSNPDCVFLATNDDATLPLTGEIFPGTGSFVGALEACTGIKPKVLGKPHQCMLDCIIQKYNFNRQRTCMVGDRLNTDIQFGQNGGLKTLAVSTGVTSEEEILDPLQAIKPHYYIPSLGHIAKVI